MKNLFFACFFLFYGLLSCIAQNARYDSTIFSAVTVTTDVEYAIAPQLNSPYNDESNTTDVSLVMDIHQPVGDTGTNRRAIIFAHGGAFVSGNKNHDDMKAFCDTFALKGYVTATIEYRLGMYTESSASCTRAVYRGLQDGRSAVRFLRANASTYDIDSSRVYMAGSSAGGFIALHTIYMDDVSEKPAETGTYIYQNPLPPFNMITAPDLGDYDIGNDLTYNGQPNAIMSLWGAVKDTVLITADDVSPVFLIHGTADNTVPFNVGSPFGYPAFPPTYGSNPIYQKLTALNLTKKESYFVPDEGHEFYGVVNGYWSNGIGGNAYWDTVVSKATVFFANQGRATLSTSAITNIGYTSATGGGNVTDEGDSTVTAKGVCWNISANPTINNSYTTDGSGTGSFTSSLTGLTGGGQTYYVRAYATNSQGTAYGGQKRFVTDMVPPGKALVFDGTDEYVQVPWSASLNPTQFTIECWVMAEGGQGTWRSPVTSRDTVPRGGYLIYAGNDDKWQFWTGDGTGMFWTNKLVGNSAVVMDIWTHIAGTYDGSEMRLYINGNLDSTLSSVTFAANDSEPLRIGAGKTEAAAVYHFPGKVDEVRIWNTARSQAEIRENMHRTLNGDEDSLVACYRFDHISGTFLFDHTVNENHGALQNMENQDWLNSTAPIPYFTVINGNWETNSTWATGQNSPVHSWSRAMIKHNITLNSNMELIEMTIDTNAVMTISTGDTLTVGGN